MKKFLGILLTATLVVSLFAGCDPVNESPSSSQSASQSSSQSDLENNSSSEAAQKPSAKSNTYESDKDGVKIKVQYPSFGIEKVDEKIKQFAEDLPKESMDGAESGSEYTSSYKLTLNDGKYISVLFETQSNVMGSAHPNLMAYAKTYTVDGDEVDVNKLVGDIDKEKMADAFYQYIKNTQEKDLVEAMFPSEKLTAEDKDSIYSAVTSREYYLVPDGIGVIHEVPHPLGDYLTANILYKDLGIKGI